MMEPNPPIAKIESYWEQVSSEHLAQGDLLSECSVAVVSADFDEQATQQIPIGVRINTLDVIIMTQSCDLENKKAPLVACCPVHSIRRFEEFSPKFKKPGTWESVRQGRQEGLHLLASTTQPENNAEAVVVDFRSIYSLPANYLSKHAAVLGPRWRLRSPFLEHFSQAFARFFMRVGLPASIPPYK